MRVVVRTILVERHVARPVVHDEKERSNADRCEIIFCLCLFGVGEKANGEISVLLVWPLFEN